MLSVIHSPARPQSDLAGLALRNGDLLADVARVRWRKLHNRSQQMPVEHAGTIILAVANYFHVPAAAILSGNRFQSVVVPRRTAYLLVRKLCGLSWAQTGAVFGRDHSSVIAGIGAIHRLANRDDVFAGQLMELEAIIRGNV